MTLRWIDASTQDFRYAVRSLLRSPIYALVSVLTLALGIGASTAIFSVVYGVLLRPLPFPEPDRIVRLWELSSSGHRMSFADPNFEDIRAQVHSLQGVAQMRSADAPVSLGGKPDRLRVAYVSKDFFSVMGVQPVVGRLFAPEEQQFGAAPAALVSYSYWQTHLHGLRNLETARFTVSNKATPIIGVLPDGFRFPGESEIWIPREIEARLPSRTAHNWQVVARLREGGSFDAARAEVSAVARRLSKQYNIDERNMVDAAVLPLKEALTSNVRPTLLILMAVAGLLLLVACANAVNLSLAQASARRGELAVRVALGASRWRLVRQFLTNAMVLCLLSGILGVMTAYIGVRALLALAPSYLPRLNEISVSVPVLLFALGLSFVVAASLGVLTAMRGNWGDVQSGLVEGGRRQGTSLRSRRTSRAIVAGQVAITLILMTGAGLLGRSMLRVLSVDPGFRTENVLTLNLRLTDLTARTEAQRVQFVDELISRLQTLPGVRSVGGTNVLPLKSDSSADGTFVKLNPGQLSPAQRELIERSTKESIQNPDPAFLKDLTAFFDDLFRDTANTGNADFVLATEGYFQTLAIPLRKGRLFNDSDTPDAPQVALISESVAQRNWPGQDPIGRTIEFGNMDGDLRLLTIVGVVGEVRKHTLEGEPRPTVYVNYRQRPRTADQFDVVLRTSADPSTTAAAVRRVLNDLDPTVPARFSTLTQVFSESLGRRRFNLLLVGVFAGCALLLAMAGVFGVLAYSVSQRTREIGVRVALGAAPGNIFRMVLAQGLATAAAGTAIGLAGSFLLTRSIRSLLFEVEPNDPITAAVVATALLLTALLAAYLPARRATRVDPIMALHSD